MYRGIHTILHGPWLTVKHTTLAYTFSFEYVMGSQIKRERPKKPSHSHTLLYVFVFVGFYICAYGDWGFIFHLDGSIWVHILSLVSLWSKHHHPFVMSLLLSVLCRLKPFSRIEFFQLGFLCSAYFVITTPLFFFFHISYILHNWDHFYKHENG